MRPRTRRQEPATPAERGPRIAVIYLAAGGEICPRAEAFAVGAREAGAAMRLRRLAVRPQRLLVATRPSAYVPALSVADLAWAHGLALGIPGWLEQVPAVLDALFDGRPAARVATVFDAAVVGETPARQPAFQVKRQLMRHGCALMAGAGDAAPSAFLAPLTGGRPQALSAAYSHGEHFARFVSQIFGAQPR